MKIDVIPFASAIESKQLKGKTVIVIDVLRATSVMITALQNGAKNIIPVLTIEEAVRTSKKLPHNSFLLCGERNAKKIEGFHLGNSPHDFTSEMVSSKTLVITTTNGTKSLNNCSGANKVLIGSFLNVEALVQELVMEKELVLYCAGTRGKFSLDDGMCAAMIIDSLVKKLDRKLSDFAQSLLMAYRSQSGNIIEILKDCQHLNFLINNGFQLDVDYCLQTNISLIVPCYDNAIITA